MWLTACSSGLNAATGISSVIALATFIGLPVSIPLGVVSPAGVSVSGVAMSTLAVFERVVSKALKNGKIDEEEFNSIQKLQLETINKLTDVALKMAAENRTQFGKSLLEEINERKKSLGTRI